MPNFARAVPFLSILLLALLVAGCGGDDATSTTDSKVIPASDTGDATTGGPTGAVDPAKGAAQRVEVKEYVNAIESCAANNTTGAYTGCLDSAKLLEFEPSLAQVTGTVTVTANPDQLGYSIVNTLDGQTFSEVHGSDGSITKTCEPADTAGCTGGTW